MTSGAQQALRRTMEIYSSTTRFAFACNQSNKIIEPLQSRCAILRYARLTDAQVVKRLNQVCEAEKVEHSEDGLAALVFSAEGDMRQAINNLQSTSSGFGFVSGDNVFRVVDSPHPIKVQAMIKACWEGKIDVALETLNELWYVVFVFGRGDCKTPIQTSRDRLGNWSPGELETWGSEEEEIVEIWSREGKGSAGMEHTIQARQTDTDRQTETDRWTDR